MLICLFQKFKSKVFKYIILHIKRFTFQEDKTSFVETVGSDNDSLPENMKEIQVRNLIGISFLTGNDSI